MEIMEWFNDGRTMPFMPDEKMHVLMSILGIHRILDERLAKLLENKFETIDGMKEFMETRLGDLKTLLDSSERLFVLRMFQEESVKFIDFGQEALIGLTLVAFKDSKRHKDILRCIEDVRKVNVYERLLRPSPIEDIEERRLLRKAISTFDKHIGDGEGERKLAALERKFPIEEDMEDDEKEDEDWQEEGNISYNSKKILGNGSNSVVYDGRFRIAPNRSVRVAVKCITPESGQTKTLLEEIEQMARSIDQSKQTQSQSREVDIHEKLLQANHHNIIRFFGAEIKGNGVYIALDFCEGTLDYYMRNQIKYPELTPKELLYQIASGIEFLHEEGVIHRDLKPDNILIRKASKNQKAKVVITDFGLSKCTRSDKCSLSGKSGTWGWISPEMNNCLEEMAEEPDKDIIYKIGKSTDIFSAGLIFYYVICNRKHPYGGTAVQRQLNIGTKRAKLDGIPDEEYTLKVLVQEMIAHDADSRPSAKQVRSNPWFWSEETTMIFFKRVSDRLQEDENLDFLKNESNTLLGSNWVTELPAQLSKHLRSRNRDLVRKNTVPAILRAIRNKGDHYYELPTDVRKDLRTSEDTKPSFPKEYIRFWMKTFPMLLWHTYKGMEVNKDSEDLQQFYETDA